MKENYGIITWLDENKDICVEALRIYFGLAMILKGVQFIADPTLAKEYMAMVNLPFFPYLFVHLVVILHLAGGLLLLLGLLTRIAALIQIPNVLGAIFFVHWQEGILGRNPGLEYVILVFVLLVFFVGYGGGRFSLDAVLKKPKGL